MRHVDEPQPRPVRDRRRARPGTSGLRDHRCLEGGSRLFEGQQLGRSATTPGPKLSRDRIRPVLEARSILHPGALDPAVTQATIDRTICVSGWTETVRPPESVTEREKWASMAAYEDTGSMDGYEYDHVVPLELGGATNDPRNLWPEPGASPNPKRRGRKQLETSGLRPANLAGSGAARDRRELDLLRRAMTRDTLSCDQAGSANRMALCPAGSRTRSR
jgi:hypothetical protein